MGCSNGNAAGNTIEEAVLQGILEIVERDSTAIWWYNRLRQPGIDLESFDDAWIGQLIREYHAIGREVWALDANGLVSRPGPRLVDGIEALARIFNPSCFTPLDPHHAVRVR